MDSNMKKVVAPVKGKEGKKPFWMQIGIMGMKNGNVWIKLNAVPTGWDGYCMGVDMDRAGDVAQGEPERASEGGSDVEPPTL